VDVPPCPIQQTAVRDTEWIPQVAARMTEVGLI
jgi:hypothetical protein